MAGPALPLAALALLALAARAHIHSHDNILRIQLWDAEGLSREPVRGSPVSRPPRCPGTVALESLQRAMEEESGSEAERFTRHRVRHKRRRTRRSQPAAEPWRFHAGSAPLNVEEYEEDPPAPTPLRRDPTDDEDEEVKKQLAVVPKCCPSGQNVTLSYDSDGKWHSLCTRSSLTFQPVFHKANDTHIWSFDTNVFETIVGNPCKHDRYRLNPFQDSTEEFYLLVNGSLFAPFNQPYSLGTKDYCMETFWNETFPAGLTLPLVCFEAQEEVKSSATFILYATGLIISVPFLLATACVYLFITELRDTHGKSLACHCICLSVAFSCLAATQLAGHAFPVTFCTVIAYTIQFSFVSCFFWLNVMSFDIFLNVRRYINSSVTRRSMRRRFAWYCVYAVVLPIVLLVVTITMQLHPAVPSTYLKPSFGVKACWFETDQAALPYFYGPVAVILISNLVIFVLTSRAFALHYNKLKDLTPLEIAHSDSMDDWVRLGTVLGQPFATAERAPTPQEPITCTERLKKYRKVFRTCCLLSLIMGLSWVLEVVSWAAGAGNEAVSVWSVFDLINALQGVVIFGIFVLQQPVRSYVKLSKLFQTCRRKSDGLEVAVVSERNSIDCGTTNGRRDFV